MGRLRFVFPIVFAFILVLASSPLPPVFALTGTGTATIDGIIGPSEWAGADHVDFDLTGGYTGTLYIMNDATNLYLAVHIADSTLETGAGQVDRVEFAFDNNNVGGPGNEVGDDLLYGYGDHLDDRFYAPAITSDTDDGGTNDGSSVATHDPVGFNNFEVSHPLDDADNTHDFSVKFGDTVGFFMDYYHGGSGAGYTTGLTNVITIQVPSPDLVIDPHGIDVNVGDSFTIRVWIKNIPDGYYMVAFDFAVVWDPTYMQLTKHHFYATDFGWTVVQDDDSGAGNLLLGANKYSQTVYWDANYIWVTLEFRCLAEGSSQISATQAETVTLRLKSSPTTESTLLFDEDEITVNQHAPAPLNYNPHVGGKVFTANKAIVVAPYLMAVLSVVAVAVVVIKRRSN